MTGGGAQSNNEPARQCAEPDCGQAAVVGIGQTPKWVCLEHFERALGAFTEPFRAAARRHYFGESDA